MKAAIVTSLAESLFRTKHCPIMIQLKAVKMGILPVVAESTTIQRYLLLCSELKYEAQILCRQKHWVSQSVVIW